MRVKKINVFLLLTMSLLILSSSPVFSNSMWSPLTDSVNSGIINTKMASNNTLSNIQVDATVINGTAIFSGQVQSQEQLNELIRIAKSVSGIKNINISKITVLNK